MEPDTTSNDVSDELTEDQQGSVAGGGGLEGLGGWNYDSPRGMGGNGGNGGAGTARPRAN